MKKNNSRFEPLVKSLELSRKIKKIGSFEKPLSTVRLHPNTLVVLSGISGSGKSQLVSQLPVDMVVSSDKIREQLFGVYSRVEVFDSLSQIKPTLSPGNYDDVTVFSIMEKMVKARLRQGLSVVVDATNLKDSDRKSVAKWAVDSGANVHVWIVSHDEPDALINNAVRDYAIPEDAVLGQLERFEKTSSLNHCFVSKDTVITNKPYVCHTQLNLDVVGDVHGDMVSLRALIGKLGYTIDEHNHIHHPEHRQLAFVGDIIDRGPDSLDCLELILQARQNGHYFVLGNHEANFIRFLEKHLSGESVHDIRSFSLKITLNDALHRYSRKELTDLLILMKSLPHYLVVDAPFNERFLGFAITHADVLYLDPLRFPKKTSLRGESDWGKVQTDFMYHMNPNNHYKLIRGHIPNNMDDSPTVYSLDDHDMKGQLKAIRLSPEMHQLMKDSSEKCSFEAATHHEGVIVSVPRNVDYHAAQKECSTRIKQLNKLKEDGLLYINVDPKTQYAIYSYSHMAFYKQSWKQRPWLLKTRGLVLDLAGNVVQHSFDKVFNYRENGTGLNFSDDEFVIAVEKLNGFLANITLTKEVQPKLLYTTSGSFDSDFIGYIDDLVSKDLRSRLFTFFMTNKRLKNRELTLSFEAIHEKDPHIVQYSENERGLYLIGARIHDINAPVMTEDELDDIAEEIGVKRPLCRVMRFKEVKELAHRVKNLEGWMIRDLDKNHTYLMKLKASHYSALKFLSRMSEQQMAKIFSESGRDSLKKRVDEEFYPVIDALSVKMTFDDYRALTELERRELILSIYDNQVD